MSINEGSELPRPLRQRRRDVASKFMFHAPYCVVPSHNGGMRGPRNPDAWKLEALKRAAEQETDPHAKEQAWLRYYEAVDNPRAVGAVDSPVRLSARSAFERGDQLFQVTLDIMAVEGRIATLASAEPTGVHLATTEFDVNEALNEIVEEGWYLHSMSTSYVQEKELSRDKFWSSGEQTALTGRLMGTYVFLRDDDEAPGNA